MDKTNFNIYSIVDNLLSDLQKKGPYFTYTIDNSSIGGWYDDVGSIKTGRNHELCIYIGEEENYIKNNQVNEENFMRLMSIIFHEYRHLVQTENYKYNPDGTKLSKIIARMTAIQKNGFSNYYFENYRNDSKEIDATSFGIRESIKYVNEKYPKINANKGIVDYIHSYISKDKYDQYGFHMFDENSSSSVSDILSQLDKRIASPIRENLKNVCDGFIEDANLQKILNREFIDKYNNLKDVYAKDSLVFNEIIQLHPEILEEYPILQDEKSNHNVEIRTEKNKEYNKTSRYLNGTLINTSKEYKNGDYEKSSKVFITNRNIKISNNYINYTTYYQKYDSSSKTFIDKSQSPILIDDVVIGEQSSMEVYNSELGKREVTNFSTFETSNNFYELESKNQSIGNSDNVEVSTLKIDNTISKIKEKLQYIRGSNKETYIYMENGIIKEKFTKTDKGTTIDKYDNGILAETFEYDENGKALIQMAGLKDLPDNYLRNCFNLSIPEYQIVEHIEPEEIYQNDFDSHIISTEKLGKETAKIQKDKEQINDVKNILNDSLKNFEKINSNHYNLFKEKVKISEPIMEQIDTIINQYEKDLINGVLQNTERQK